MNYYVFDTQAEFDKADRYIISQLHAASGNPQWNQITTSWAQYANRVTDGKFVMPVCLSVLTTYKQEAIDTGGTWFPQITMPIL